VSYAFKTFCCGETKIDILYLAVFIALGLKNKYMCGSVEINFPKKGIWEGARLNESKINFQCQ